MPEKLERCLRKVRRKGGVKSPYAVCVASTGIKKKKGGGWTKGKTSKRRSRPSR